MVRTCMARSASHGPNVLSHLYGMYLLAQILYLTYMVLSQSPNILSHLYGTYRIARIPYLTYMVTYVLHNPNMLFHLYGMHRVSL